MLFNEMLNSQVSDKRHLGLLSSFLLFLYVFLYIYTPLAIPFFNVIHLLAVVAYFNLLTKYKAFFLRFLFSPVVREFYFAHGVLIVYSICLLLVFDADSAPLYYLISTVVEVVPCAIFLSVYLLRRGFVVADLYKMIIGVGLVQTGFVLLTMVSPSLRDLLIINTWGADLAEFMDAAKEFRVFGLARSYTFAMPLFQGLCVILCVVMGKLRSRWYYLPIPLLLFSIVVNARTALISLPIVYLVSFLFRARKNFTRELFEITVIVFMVVFAGALVLGLYQTSSESLTLLWWIGSGIEEVLQYAETGQAEGNLDSLTGSMWFFPSDLGFVFGLGENVFTNQYRNSDIGYVVNIFYGGLVFSAILYFSYAYFIVRSVRSSAAERILFFSLLFLLFLSNYKGQVFRPNEIINGVVLLVVYSLIGRLVVFDRVR